MPTFRHRAGRILIDPETKLQLIAQPFVFSLLIGVPLALIATQMPVVATVFIAMIPSLANAVRLAPLRARRRLP